MGEDDLSATKRIRGESREFVFLTEGGLFPPAKENLSYPAPGVTAFSREIFEICQNLSRRNQSRREPLFARFQHHQRVNALDTSPLLCRERSTQFLLGSGNDLVLSCRNCLFELRYHTVRQVGTACLAIYQNSTAEAIGS